MPAITFDAYLQKSQVTEEISSCGLFRILRASNAFSIIENGGGCNRQRFDYSGHYTHAYVNKNLTRMRQPLLKLFLASLPSVEPEQNDMHLSVIAWMKLTPQLKEHFLTEHKVGKYQNKVIVQRGLVNSWVTQGETAGLQIRW